MVKADRIVFITLDYCVRGWSVPADLENILSHELMNVPSGTWISHWFTTEWKQKQILAVELTHDVNLQESINLNENVAYLLIGRACLNALTDQKIV